MVAKTAGRKGRPWYRACTRVYAEENICYLCGRHVDQTLPPRTSWSRSAHHLIPPDIRPDLANARTNLRLAHFGCNSAHGRGEYETRPGRRCTLTGCLVCTRRPSPRRLVVVLFGPPGAGKTTLAHQSGLTIYDRDDPTWTAGGDAAFRQALDQLGHNPTAQAVAIRSGATSSARAKTIQQVRATHGYLVLADPATCHQRVGHRRRADLRTSHGAIEKWFRLYDHHDGLPAWPGWDHITRPAAANNPGASHGGSYRGSRNW